MIDYYLSADYSSKAYIFFHLIIENVGEHYHPRIAQKGDGAPRHSV